MIRAIVTFFIGVAVGSTGMMYLTFTDLANGGVNVIKFATGTLVEAVEKADPQKKAEMEQTLQALLKTIQEKSAK